MTKLAIPSPVITTIPVHGSEEVFPVRRVYCIGRNYADHVIDSIKRMSNDTADPIGSDGGVAKVKKSGNEAKDGEGNSVRSTIDSSKQGKPIKTGWEAVLALDKKVQTQRPVGY